MSTEDAKTAESNPLSLDGTVVRYLDGELPDDQREELTATMVAMPPLARWAEELVELSQALEHTVRSTAPAGAPAPQLTFERPSQWRRWAAGIVLLSALAASWSPVRAWWVDFRDDAGAEMVSDPVPLPGPSENAVGFRPFGAPLVVRIEQAPPGATLSLIGIEGDVAWMEAGDGSEVVVGPEGFAVETTTSPELNLYLPPGVTSIAVVRDGLEVERYTSESWQERTLLPLN